MSKVITLPSCNTVTLRDPSTLRVKDRKKVIGAASNQEGLLQALSMVDGLIAVLVESWSFDLIIPSVHIASLDELTMPDYDAIAAEVNAVQSTIFPDFTKSEANEKNPDSPLDGSNG